jgi:3-oxoacyl-[acyl-carrier protein] reductase
MNSRKLNGKVAIVTGAGRGIGRSVALALAEEGANVVIVSRNPSEMDRVAQEVKDLKVNMLAIKADVSQEREVEEMVKKTLAKFKGIDILVNNAGIPGPTEFITQIEIKDWDDTINTNLKGVFLCSRAVLPQMIEQKGGNIINISSGAGKRRKDDSFLSPSRSLVYSVSKFGVEGFTLALAAQVNKFNINVNSLCPGPTDTRFHATAPLEKRALMRKADDIKRVAIFLATQGPMGITGESIDADTWGKIYLSREF